MDNLFNKKWFVRGISLAFAILLYVVVNVELTTNQSDSRLPGGADTDRVQTLRDVPVNIRIDAEKFVVSGVPEFITVSLEGPNSILMPTVMQRNFEFYVDLTDFEEGAHTVDIEYTKVSEELKVYIEPKTINVTIEERVTEQFLVNVEYINIDQLPLGYELEEPEISPETVTITTSRSTFEQIAMVKVYIDVAGMTEPINKREVPVNVYDSQGNGLGVRIEPETVVVSVDVDNPSKVIPLRVATTNEPLDPITNITLTPELEEIEVFAVSDLLASMEFIETEEIDLSTIDESGSIDVKLDLPEGTQVLEDTIKVKVEVELSETIDDIPIEYNNLASDRNLTFVTPNEPMMSITVVGNDQDVKELSKEDFKLTIDVKDLTEGEHQIPVSMDGPDHVKASMEYEQIVIVIGHES